MPRDLLYREIDNLKVPDNRLFEIKSSADFSFDTLSKKYPGYKEAGFASGNVVSSIVLYAAIGGNFARNALRKKGKGYVIEPDFNNSCTVRMSTAFNFGGDPIKRYRGITILKGTRTGKLKNKNYLFRVKDLYKYLKKRYGKPTIEISDTTLSAADKENAVKGKQGIIIFNIDYKDATGHATLWNGTDIAGGGHDKNHYFEKASKIYFWEIK